MTLPTNPILYEINTAVWLAELRGRYGPAVALGSVPSAEWDAIAATGVHAVWLMGVWERSPEGRRIALRWDGNWRDFRRALPDLADDDILASPYCVRRYHVDQRFGGDAGLAAARAALAARGLGLVLDFVPNHLATDHPWVASHPDWFVHGTADDFAREPDQYFQAAGTVFACGKDPNYSAWGDVVQVNAFAPGLRAAYVRTLTDLAHQCDGVRCDMAMLLINRIFAGTWRGKVGETPAEEFWPAITSAVHASVPGFRFIAEAYWDLEWDLVQQGFDYCYDKRLYDRLEAEPASSIEGHLQADPWYQAHLVRFVENHDEPRAVAAFGERVRAAAAIVLSAPGARLLHEGQFEGRRVRVPVFLQRRRLEPVDASLRAFYAAIVADAASPVFSVGDWVRPERRGWPDNESWRTLLPIAWRSDTDRRLVVVNYGPTTAQARIAAPWQDVHGRTWRLHDLVSGAAYERDGNALAGDGLFVELPPWGVHWFRWE